MPVSIDLTGKKALVTGASSGIGAEIAVALAQAGAAVALGGRDADRLRTTANRIRALGTDCVQIIADLTTPDGPSDVVNAALAQLGGLTTLVNAVGVFEPNPFTEGVEVLDRHWASNVRAPYALACAAVEHLRPGGSVLFISSIGGHVGFPGCAAYGATKGAIELLVRSLAVEEAPNGVRVNAIAPGNVRTPMNQDLFADPEYEAQELALTPLGRIGEVTDIAPAAVFLVSDSASYITGTSLVIDGGVVAG
ncbi:SDR family NAD(P)-dependent oxidoreductase [Wenjunlia tyrosinilytica]|uniref:Glucose-1-dehydrogenase n=1 Tax=Wenjunlia tyrosinilytica TaxID=1544741 RepID=A0A918E019_9ACTN|nr:SDR family oxidoreductase [Wenjunlia tyrosinilytica]GGO97213.1 glucose-1-dehydrogenase [Wenjunlia tyrosinilytica]